MCPCMLSIMLLIFTVCVSAYGACKFAVSCVNGNGRVELQDIFKEAAGSLDFGGPVQGEMLSYGDDVLVVNLEEFIL